MTESRTGGLAPTERAPEVAAVAEEGRWVTATAGAAGFRTVLRAREHEIVADEPVSVGGTDGGATPYELLLGAIGGCTAITLRMYADRKGWPLEGVEVRLRTARAHAPDCADCEAKPVGMDRVEWEVELAGPLDAAQRRRLLDIAARCPVKRTVEQGLTLVPAS